MDRRRPLTPRQWRHLLPKTRTLPALKKERTSPWREAPHLESTRVRPAPARWKRAQALSKTLYPSANLSRLSRVSPLSSDRHRLSKLLRRLSEIECARTSNVKRISQYSSHYRPLFCLDKLYWVSDEAPPQNIHNAFFFNIDNVSLSSLVLRLAWCLIRLCILCG